VWLLLYNLLADGAARSRMEMSEARCEALLKLKRHFNELLLDQARGTIQQHMRIMTRTAGRDCIQSSAVQHLPTT
jgi:hypothetical protein